MDKVLDQLAAAGLEIQGPLEFGRLVRCKVDGERGGKRSGWYVLHELRLDSGDTVIVGRYGNWKRYGAESLKIEWDRPSLSPAERQRLEAEQQRLREAAAEERKQRAEQAATRAARLWRNLPVEGHSPYLKRKKVPAIGVRFARGGAVVVPVRNADDALVGLQFIPAEGPDKKFLTGTAFDGACHVLDVEGRLQAKGSAYDGRLFIAEGYATAASVEVAAKHAPVVVAFTAGNLERVAKSMREKYPLADIIIAGDNDRYTTHPVDGTPWNPGIEYATKAAAAVRGRLAVPDFGEIEGGTDWNDLHVAAGIKHVREQLRSAVVRAPVVCEPEPPDLDSPPPSMPDDSAEALTLEVALRRFALAMPDGKVWDFDKQQLLKKSAARDLMGKGLWDEWVNAVGRRTVDQAVVRKQAAAAAAAGGGGLQRALDRFVYLYPTTDAWDVEKRMRVPLSALRHAIADSFDAWIKSDRRKEIDVASLVFDPTCKVDLQTHINTFRGLPLQPYADDGSCQAILELLVHLCNGESETTTWLLKWLAYPLQHVGAKMASAVLMHSHVQGSGKSLFFDGIIKKIYGEYGSTLGQHQLESQYTDWRSQLLFALFEEIFSRDQKYSHTGTLKHMITGSTQRIEKKFVSGWEEANYMNAVFLSNEIQPFPLEATDRRMLVIWPKAKLPDELKQRVAAELQDKGLEAFYAFLLRVPLDDFNTHTQPPMTEAKERLIDFGRPAWEVFYREWRDGYLEIPWAPCLSDQIFRVYASWCSRRREHTVSQTKFGGFLAAQEEIRRRTDVHHFHGQTQKKGTFFVPQEPDKDWRQNEGETIGSWLGRCRDKFEELLRSDGPPP